MNLYPVHHSGHNHKGNKRLCYVPAVRVVQVVVRERAHQGHVEPSEVTSGERPGIGAIELVPIPK